MTRFSPSLLEAHWPRFLVASSLLLGGCSSAPITEPEQEALAPAPIQPGLSFKNDIRPIFSRHCIECHGIEAEEAGLDLRTLKSIRAGGDSGPAIVEGYPEESLLFEMIYDDFMPPEGDLLSRAEFEQIRLWIASGAQR